MNKYINIDDIENVSKTIKEAIQLKQNPFQFHHLVSRML